MKIAILSMYSGLVSRGVETWVQEFSRRAVKKDVEVLVIQGGKPAKKTTYNIKIVPANVELDLRKGERRTVQIFLLPYRILINSIFTFRSIPALRQFDPDIVMPTNGGVQSLILRLYCLLTGKKLVITGHAGLGAPDKWNILVRPDAFITPSVRGKDWAEELSYSRGLDIRYIPHGVDLDRFVPQGKKAKVDLERPVILCVSSLDFFKRTDLTVRAVATLDKGSLLVVGGQRDTGKTKELGKELLGKKYEQRSARLEEMPKYYRSANVFTLVSDDTEAFGLVYLEAMACGLPVVATNDKLRQEIVGDAGILVDPTNIEEYANALEKALEKDWGDKPRRQAEKFSWDNVVEWYIELFDELLSK